jgi:hypothetical protein
MNLEIYEISEEEKQTLIKTIQAALAIPFIDSIEDFIWESIFCYFKRLPIIDPTRNIRSKALFDIVDTKNNIGWSAKAIQWQLKLRGEFEIVIQRADILKKREELGFPNLTIDSDPNELGAALLEHWNMKINTDALKQKVSDKRICIILKSKDNRRFAYVEEALMEYKNTDLYWKWTDETKTGLQGIRKSDNFCVYRWYPNQKQFFERFLFLEHHFSFEIEPKRLSFDSIINFIHLQLEDK